MSMLNFQNRLFARLRRWNGTRAAKVWVWLLVLASFAVFSPATLAQASSTPSRVAQSGQSGPYLRILSPANGEKIGVNFVNLQFQLTNPAAAASDLPTFELRLDARDAIDTSSNTHTFTGLNPGRHTISVQLIDANGSPVRGADAQVQFYVIAKQSGPTAESSRSQLIDVALHQSSQQNRSNAETAPSSRNDGQTAEDQSKTQQQPLPSTSTALPLLSVIGFGVLVGGIASAMKTR